MKIIVNTVSKIKYELMFFEAMMLRFFFLLVPYNNTPDSTLYTVVPYFIFFGTAVFCCVVFGIIVRRLAPEDKNLGAFLMLCAAALSFSLLCPFHYNNYTTATLVSLLLLFLCVAAAGLKRLSLLCLPAGIYLAVSHPEYAAIVLPQAALCTAVAAPVPDIFKRKKKPAKLSKKAAARAKKVKAEEPVKQSAGEVLLQLSVYAVPLLLIVIFLFSLKVNFLPLNKLFPSFSDIWAVYNPLRRSIPLFVLTLIYWLYSLVRAKNSACAIIFTLCVAVSAWTVCLPLTASFIITLQKSHLVYCLMTLPLVMVSSLLGRNGLYDECTRLREHIKKEPFSAYALFALFALSFGIWR